MALHGIGVPWPYIEELPPIVQKKLFDNFSALRQGLDGILGDYDAKVIGGATDNPGTRTFGTVHAAATYLDSIGFTSAVIHVSGTVTETAALVAANAPATVELVGARAIWNHASFASGWTSLTVRNIDVRPGTSKSSQVFTVTTSGTVALYDVVLTSSLPAVNITVTDGLLRAFNTNFGDVDFTFFHFLWQCNFSADSRTFSGNVSFLWDCTRDITNASRSWTVTSLFVHLDVQHNNGVGFGNTLTVTVSAARWLYAKWTMAGNSGTPTQNPQYVSLTASSAVFRTCVVEGTWLGSLALTTPLAPAIINAHFSDADIAGPAVLNLTLGEDGGNGNGAVVLRNQISGSINSRFASTTATLLTGTALVGSALVISANNNLAAGTSKGYALDASSTRNVIIFPRHTTAAGEFGAASTDAGTLNVVIDENGAAPAAHGTTHNPGGTDPITTAAPGTIQPDDTAAEGTATSVARSDHRHAIAAAIAGAIEPDDAAAEGSSTSFSRADHKHSIAAATPVAVGSANAEGSSTSFARADHVHDSVHPFVEANDTAGATLTDNTETLVSWDTNVAGSSTLHSTSTNPSRFIADRDGLWGIDIVIGFASNATNSRRITIRLNNAGATAGGIVGRANNGTSPNRSTFCTLSKTFDMNTSDYLEVTAFQDSGGNLALDVAARVHSVVFYYIGPS